MTTLPTGWLVRPCRADEVARIAAVIDAAAERYRGVIPADRWHEPYMPEDELRAEIADGVRFHGIDDDDGRLVAVMGLQEVDDVALIRHAYTQPAMQGRGLGGALLEHLRRSTDRRLLVGTWAAATWAIGFYQHHGFVLLRPAASVALLRRYWSVPDRQIETSVVLTDGRWIDRVTGDPDRKGRIG